MIARTLAVVLPTTLSLPFNGGCVVRLPGFHRSCVFKYCSAKSFAKLRDMLKDDG